MVEKRDTKTLLPLLRGLLEQRLQPGDAELLVNGAIRSTEYILSWISAQRNYRLHLLGLEIADIAYDFVGELFAAEEEQCCHRLRQSLLNMGSLEADADLLGAYDAILFKNVHQQSSRLFAEVNPLHHHLSCGLRAHVQRSKDVHAHHALDGRWYYKSSMEYAHFELPALPGEDLRRYIRLNDSMVRSTIVPVFRSILQFLDEQKLYRKAVLEADVIDITSEIVGLEFQGSHPDHEEIRHRHDTELLTEILFRALEECRPWLENTYLRTKRLSENELKLFLRAIRMYFLDVMQGEEAKGTFSYLRCCMPGLTHTRFRESYRRRFEYILSHVMEVARAHFGKEESLLR